MDDALAAEFARRFDELAAIGRDPATGGRHRLAWTAGDAAARRWFADEAERLGLEVERDRNANLWAWWSPSTASGDAVATGSHLDTVPGGGAFDGALGVVAGLSAVEGLRRRGLRPARPLAVAAFADEEGVRFDTPCLGSALLTGELEPADVVDRRDDDGTRLGDVLEAAGVDAGGLGAEPARLQGLSAFVELHIEQGRRLAADGAALGVATGAWPHGRWRLTAHGGRDHAGTAPLATRRDPTLVLAAALTAARERALSRGTIATVGKMAVTPGATTVIPSRVDAWLDARAPDGAALDRFLDEWASAVDEAGVANGCDHAITSVAFARPVTFDEDLRRRLERRAREQGREATGSAAAGEAGPSVGSTGSAGASSQASSLASPVGHDAAILAEQVPAALVLVRNPAGVSHSPAEHAEREDCLAGLAVLTGVLADLVT